MVGGVIALYVAFWLQLGGASSAATRGAALAKAANRIAATLMGATMSVVITGLFPGKGRIESITGGISAANAASSTQGLPNVDPIFTWGRLAQRIPVRVRIEQIPPEVPLVAGMTCSVSVVGERNAGGQARPGALLSAGKPALGKSNGRTKGY
jgi:hypothetical protein